MDHQLDRQSVVWWGPGSGSLGWLRNHISDWCQSSSNSKPPLRLYAIDDLEELLSIASHDCQRIILACENRWDYPDTAIRQLAFQYPEVPMAVAVSDWWLGWRRTGIGHFGPIGFLCLPWFRWWDGWVPWLSGKITSMLGPFPSNAASVAIRGSIRDALDIQQPKGATEDVPDGSARLTPTTAIVLGSCNQTVQTWTQKLRTDWALRISDQRDIVGLSIQSECLPDCLEGPTDPELVLWDSTRLSTFRGPDRNLNFAVEELKGLADRFPASRIWVAWDQPTWTVVEELQNAKLVFELLGKPYFGSFSSAALARR